MGIFNPENKFWIFMEKITNLFFLALLWLLFSLPLITIGASTVACYQFTLKQIKDEEGYLFKSFFKAFKTSFFQATLVWIVTLLVITFFYYDYFLLFNMPSLKSFRIFLFAIISFLAIITTIVLIYLYPIIALYKVKLKKAVKDSLIMGLQHPLVTIILILIAALVVTAIYYLPPFFIFWLILGIFSSSFCFRYVFNTYEEEL